MANEILTPAGYYVQASNLPTGWLSPDSQSRAVADALLRFGRDFPRRVVGEFAGNATELYDLSTLSLTGWTEGISTVSLVEYPLTDGIDKRLDASAWDVYDDLTLGSVLRFAEYEPASTETIRIIYSVAWTESTVPANRIGPVAKLAAANMARMVAARFAQEGESTVTADVFNRSSASDRMLALARHLESQYEEEMGLSAGEEGQGAGAAGVAPACSFTNLEPTTGHGYGRLTHGNGN